MPMLTIAMADVPQQDAGLASGIVNVSQQVSGALGLALLSTFATNHSNGLIAAGHPLNTSLLSGYRLAYAFGIIAVLIGIIVALVVLRRPKRAAVSEMTADAAGSDEPRVIRSGSEDEDLGGDVTKQPGEVLLA
jgi:sugar phosphate permease